MMALIEGREGGGKQLTTQQKEVKGSWKNEMNTEQTISEKERENDRREVASVMCKRKYLYSVYKAADDKHKRQFS